MSSVRRISVVGSTGSGKTTLARELSVRLDLPFHELDLMRDAPGGDVPGNQPEPGNFAEAVNDLVSQDQWVIDGHYRDVRHMIWQRSDLVVHLDYSPVLIAVRLVSRFLHKRRANRSSANSANGASWKRRLTRLAKTIRERREYTKIFSGPDFDSLPVIKLKSPRETRNWIASLEKFSSNNAAAVSG